MGSRRFTDGAVTITLDGGMEAFVLKAVRAAAGGALDIMEDAAEKQAAEARTAWYQHVAYRTGKSGDIQAITTITPNLIKVSIGSTDKRIVNYKGIDRAKERAKRLGLPAPMKFDGTDKMLAAFVHEPGALSMVFDKFVSHEAYWEAIPSLRGPEPKTGHPAELMKPNPRGATGRKLLQILVKGPTKRLALKLGPAILAEIKERMSHGG